VIPTIFSFIILQYVSKGLALVWHLGNCFYFLLGVYRVLLIAQVIMPCQHGCNQRGVGERAHTNGSCIETLFKETVVAYHAVTLLGI